MKQPARILRSAAALLALLALAAVVTGAPSAAATPRPLIRVQVPLNQNVSDLVKGRLVEKLTCALACRTKTTIYIRARLARRLGFEGVHETPVAVGSRSVTVAAGRTARVRIGLDSTAQKLMSRANLGIQLLGQVTAQAARPSSRRGTASWVTFLTP
jgi:hypothetical protein